ncbi:MAG: IS1 family transposase [Dysgonamonadaceae bacterium]|jgi:IS1 family transposase/transposase-like protein|nr:IS1 family transposase [Dysgonamonadaceae bacterium]
MKIKITLYCPNCQSANVKRNGKKVSKKQNYFCKDCGRQFIGNHALSYKGCHSELNQKILFMLVRGVGIRDVAEIEKVSIRKVLSVLVCSNHNIKPKQKHYDSLEVDEFWTYVNNKQHKVWLIYAYHRATGEIVAYVWGKRDLKTAKRLRENLKTLEVQFDCVCSDSWESFLVAFREDNLVVGKQHTVGIEGNNCRLRHRIRRAFRKTCCFSKKLFNHFKAFDLALFYINFGFV